MRAICNAPFHGFGTRLTREGAKAMKRLTISLLRLGNRLTVGLPTSPSSHCNSTTSFVTHSPKRAPKSPFPLANCNGLLPVPFLGFSVTWDEIGYAALFVLPILAAFSVYWNCRRQK